MRRISVYYISGGNRERPGSVALKLRRNDINLELMQRIPYEDVIEVTTHYEVKDKQLSAGKAVAGGLLFGGIGLIAGAVMGGKKIEGVLRIKYRLGTEEKEMLLGTKQADVIKREILVKMGQAEKPKGVGSGIVSFYKWFYSPVLKGVKHLTSKPTK